MGAPRVVFTRHARGRMRLYGIEARHVTLALTEPDSGPEQEGSRYAVLKQVPGAFKGLPLKVVYVREEGRLVVLSAYPLKRSYRR